MKFSSTERNVLIKDFTLKCSRSPFFRLETCIYTKKLRRFIFFFPYSLRRRFSHPRPFTFSKNEKKKAGCFFRQKEIFIGRNAWLEPFEILKVSTIFNHTAYKSICTMSVDWTTIMKNVIRS